MRKSFSGKSTVKAWFALLTAFSLAGCAGVKEARDFRPWGTFLQNGARANVSPDAINVPLALSWKKDVSEFKLLRGFPREELSSPAIAGGVLYIGSADNATFYSLDLESGKVLWKLDADYPIDAAPSVGGGMACFGTLNGILRCVDAATGKQMWQFQAKSGILSAPVITDDRLYFSSSDDRVYCISLKTGEKLWSYTKGTYQTVAPRIYGSPAYSGGRVFQFFSDGYVMAISAETGKEIWGRRVVRNFDSSQQTRRTPLVEGEMVYVIDDNFSLEALDAGTGEVKSIYNIIKVHDFIVPDKKTVVIAGNDQVISFDRATGAILWKKDLKKKPLSSVFAAGEYVFILSNYRHAPLGIEYFSRDRGFVEALSLKTGETVWEERLKSSVNANGAAAETRIALLTNKGIIEVFGPK